MGRRNAKSSSLGSGSFAFKGHSRVGHQETPPERVSYEADDVILDLLRLSSTALGKEGDPFIEGLPGAEDL